MFATPPSRGPRSRTQRDPASSCAGSVLRGDPRRAVSQADHRVSRDGSLVLLATSAPTRGAALCRNVRVGDTVYGANACSATLSSWRINRDGTSTLTAPISADTGAGPIDLAASGDQRYLYVQQAVAGALTEFRINADASLTPTARITGLPSFHAGGMEGLAAG